MYGLEIAFLNMSAGRYGKWAKSEREPRTGEMTQWAEALADFMSSVLGWKQ